MLKESKMLTFADEKLVRPIDFISGQDELDASYFADTIDDQALSDRLLEAIDRKHDKLEQKYRLKPRFSQFQSRQCFASLLLELPLRQSEDKKEVEEVILNEEEATESTEINIDDLLVKEPPMMSCQKLVNNVDLTLATTDSDAACVRTDVNTRPRTQSMN